MQRDRAERAEVGETVANTFEKAKGFYIEDSFSVFSLYLPQMCINGLSKTISRERAI
jgi:hypothetical protein